MAEVIRIGTRGSLLATTQAGTMRDALVASGHPAELVIISTAGDRSTQPIADIGVGVFTAALREAIAAGQVEVILKDWKQTEGAVHLVMPPGGPRPARVEALIEFLADRLSRARR